MFTLEEIQNMSQEEFTKNWKSGEIQRSALVLIGAYEEIKEDQETHES
jgi:hypothetical protein